MSVHNDFASEAHLLPLMIAAMVLAAIPIPAAYAMRTAGRPDANRPGVPTEARLERCLGKTADCP